MNNHRIRNVIPPIYGLLVIVGFIVSTTAGVVVLAAGGAISGLLWSALSGGPGSGDRNRDRSARTERRASRR
jgi:hypothetical protein